MISAVIVTHNSARHLVRCLAPLVSGVADGLVREAIVADAGSTDETLEMAEAAGCRIVAGETRAGVVAARAEWVLVLPARAVLQDGWIEAARRFIEGGLNRAACFTYARGEDARLAEWLVNVRARLGAPSAEQGRLAPRALYAAPGRVRVLRARVMLQT